ncbi:palmitoyl-protein thioesterase [Cryptococcus neoformans var. grubii Br795]|nr:palmitoyl-protein thioesterase [Cryptococcus neoformans var. grubii AD1-83a]OXG55168.1 palmitoyl-protein thioesterase [Cryptococcus neoformans var. grubii Th84]OXG69793.1 palmitoyl-protein thioesterase [Cryptococcus neoformans var. grubii c8]OXG70574.1 palmitoyl-protein thioesterase [Cryptococcus neoformans var. grubii MW-RSA1955]OXG74007.1 palmitoyl-protein thioesterase [Cryptococcus neoformans var. grubii CHC193]OXG89515.1 palmitoyl-protein thioesterase [Cryptococcus neoformans var. grubi
MRGLRFTFTLALFFLNWTLAAPASDQLVLSNSNAKPRPLVIWHGLGDTALSTGVENFINMTQTIHPGIFVHSVQIPEDGRPDDERKAGFWGNAGEQGEEGCKQIRRIPELAEGFDGIGFSQGGLFLRHYIQYCNGPPVHNLITFGTPHYGISALIPCPTPPTLSCLLAARAARAGIYRPWAQEHLVQAAYFRDTERLDEFYEVNEFLRDLNGERPFAERESIEEINRRKGKRGEGKGLKGLGNLVAIIFDDDRTVSPAQSSHFASYAPNNKSEIIPLHEQPLYKEDWIGLKDLDEKGGLRLEHCPGEHMDLGGKRGCGENMVRKWVGWV